MTPKNSLILVLLILFIIVLGYTEEFIFVHVNEHLYHLYFNTEFSRMSNALATLRSWSYDDLMWLKWGMTIVSTILYFLSTIAVFHLIFKRKRFILFTAILYAVVIFVSFILYMGGSLIDFPREGYRLSRFAMGFITSPVPLMALIPAFTLSKSSNS